jgi:D-arabinose 1-dehydrogenase-like Zn-dependent alcohol dehydrogenase
MFQMCKNESINGITMDGGCKWKTTSPNPINAYLPDADAEYVLLNTEAVVNVPKDVDPADFAPILCAG